MGTSRVAWMQLLTRGDNPARRVDPWFAYVISNSPAHDSSNLLQYDMTCWPSSRLISLACHAENCVESRSLSITLLLIYRLEWLRGAPHPDLLDAFQEVSESQGIFLPLVLQMSAKCWSGGAHPGYLTLRWWLKSLAPGIKATISFSWIILRFFFLFRSVMCLNHLHFTWQGRMKKDI